MSRTDTIADAFTIIRNGARVRKEDVLIPHSNLLLKVCEILKQEGYIEDAKEVEINNFRLVKVYLKYQGRKSVIKQIRKVSTSGRRIYMAKKDIPSVLRGYGLAIISTSHGVLTDKQAREQGVGGEVIGMIW